MRFNSHLELAGKHAFLSASKYHWIRYDEEKLDNTYRTALAAQRGTELHEFAAMAIRLKRRMPRTKETLNQFVNDVLGYKMQSEQILYYSDNAFGTADAISFKNGILRIFDLKTGVTKASVNQLEIYAALFCLEYGYKPVEFDEIDLRIYQNDEVQEYDGDPDVITHIMDKIISFDNRINEIRMEVWA